MAVWNYKEGGTRVFATGPSVADDWTDANCFDSAATANVEWHRCLLTEATDGDELIFYDEGVSGPAVTHNLETGSTSSGPVGTFTIKSRSGNPEKCIIRCSVATTVLMNHNNVTNAAAFIYSGLSISGPVANYTSTGRAFLQASGECTGLTVDNCILGNIKYAVNAAENISGLIFSSGTGGGAGRSLTLNDVIIENITTPDWYGGAWIGHVETADTLLITGTLTIRNCTIDATTTLIRAGLWCEGPLNITGDVIISDIDMTVAGTTNALRAIFYSGGLVTCDVTGSITADRVTSFGGTASCAILFTGSPFNVNNITGRNIRVEKTGANSVGCLFTALGVGAIGSAKNIRAEDNWCFSGAAIYYSDGASGTMENIIVKRCYCGEHGAIYLGGYRNVDVIGFTVEDCTSGDTGPGLFCHTHPVSTDQPKVVTISNGTIVNCQGDLDSLNAQGDGNSMALAANNAVHSMTVTVNNVICRSGQATDEILLTEAGVNMGLITFNSCNVEGGAAKIDEADLNTASTKNNVTSDDPLFTNVANGDLTLLPTSPLLNAGIKHWTGVNPDSAGGEPIPDFDIDIGGIQSTHGPFHPENL